MHGLFAQPVCPPHSPAWRMAPPWKLSLALGMILAVALAPRFLWSLYGAAGALVVLAMLWMRARWLPFLKRLLVLEPLIIGVALLSLLQENGSVVFAAMVCKSTLCLAVMVLLSATTPFTQILPVLSRFGVPALLVTTLALTHRYLFVLWDEAARMKRARLSRTISPAKIHLWSALASVLSQLFARAMERGERIYAAMCARGWKA